ARIGGARVAGDDRALVAGDDQDVWIVGRDPDLVVVVAAGGAADHVPRLAAVAAAVHGDVRHVDDVRVLRIDGDLLEIPAAAPQRLVGPDAPPRRPGVVRAEDPALTRRRRRRAARRLRRRGRRGW